MGLSRIALWNEISGVSIVEPILITAYQREEERAWREGLGDSPHGSPWFTSFHASKFPGDDPYACARAAVYGLMGLPETSPIEPRLRAWFDLGKNLELDWIRRFAAEGVLLSADQTAGDDFQTGFVDREHWLTGASDAIILPMFWRKSHCVEVKTTSHEKVMAMKNDHNETPKLHEKYLRQIKTYISLSNESQFCPTVTLCESSWAILRPILPDSPMLWCPIHENFACDQIKITLDAPDDGTLIYSSREEPLTTVSYYVSLDEEMMAAGREKLTQYREAFLAGEIPEHPREKEKAKWSVTPCQYCEFKALGCKADYTGKVKKLEESNVIAGAKKIRPDYDYAKTRAAVLRRWGVK
jgi:hypothetical protein